MIVAVHGLGLMGASLGAALRKRGVARVIGIARRAETARRAVELGAADEATTDLGRAFEADIVVLATPVRVILATLRQVPLRAGATLTDLGSTKTEIVRAAAGLPFVGGHPMAGSERSGVESCDHDLYVGAPYLLVGDRNGRVREIAERIGARPIDLPDAETHDRIVAANSHIPYLVAYALRATGRPELAGPSFRDATRVAGSQPDMVADFLLTNGPAIGEAAAEFRAAFDELVEIVRRGDERALRRRIGSDGFERT